jgi:hypothetical protein
MTTDPSVLAILQQFGLHQPDTAVLDSLAEESATSLEVPDVDALGEMIAEQTIGCRVQVTRFGCSKAFTKEQRERAAETFGADAKLTRASKVLVDTKNEHYKRVTDIIREARQFWHLITAEYEEDGIRLLRKDRAERFVSTMEEYKQELEAAKRVLQNHEDDLRREASRLLDELYNPADYPGSIANEFSIQYDFPNLAPSPELVKISQELFEKQTKLYRAKMEEAVHTTISGFASELHELVSHLHERLTPDEEGNRKVFHKTTLENLSTFFQSFRDVASGYDTGLDSVVKQAEQVLQGVTPDELRKDALTAGEVRTKMAEVLSAIDQRLLDAPKRSIILD